MSLIAALVPPAAAAAEARGDAPEAPLWPEEARALGEVGPLRQREFTLGRACVRRAFAGLGVSPRPVGRGPDREPVWPAGFVGSITHCPGYCAAAVARAADLPAIGIDAALNEPLPEGIVGRIAGRAEREWIERAPSRAICWDTLVFSIKESVFKVWFPLARRWLGFADAVVAIDPDGQAFQARLLVAGPRVRGGELAVVTGQYACDGRHIVTAASVYSSAHLC